MSKKKIQQKKRKQHSRRLESNKTTEQISVNKRVIKKNKFTDNIIFILSIICLSLVLFFYIKNAITTDTSALYLLREKTNEINTALDSNKIIFIQTDSLNKLSYYISLLIRVPFYITALICSFLYKKNTENKILNIVAILGLVIGLFSLICIQPQYIIRNNIIKHNTQLGYDGEVEYIDEQPNIETELEIINI